MVAISWYPSILGELIFVGLPDGSCALQPDRCTPDVQRIGLKNLCGPSIVRSDDYLVAEWTRMSTSSSESVMSSSSAAAGERSPFGERPLRPREVRELRKLVHELNNVVTSLLASGHVLCHELPKQHSLYEVAVDIDAAGQRATSLTTQMRHILRDAEDEPAALPMRGSVHGTETVLLVEDEPTVNRTIARILRGAGYEVLQASDGTEALTVAERFDRPIALLLTDYIMPGVTGDELAKEIRARRPNIRVLLMSGYLGNRVQLALSPSATLLPKPFTADTLMSRVRDALDHRAALPIAYD